MVFMNINEKKVEVRHICKYCIDWIRSNSKTGRCLLTNKRTDNNFTCKEWAQKHETISNVSETFTETRLNNS